MALRKLVMNKKLREKKAELAELRKAAEAFKTREDEIAEMIEAAKTDEEQAAIDEAIEEFENEKTENANKQQSLTEEISGIEAELAELDDDPTPAPPTDERSRNRKMPTNRTKFFGMNVQERDAFLGTEEVKEFLERVRKARNEERSISGTELLIPETVLDLVRENMEKYSKLVNKVRFRSVPGRARQNIMGHIPEAVWTDMIGSINEISFGFSQIETDGYKVSGIIYISNSILEDSDLNLAAEIIDALGVAIGVALDKAILYGNGSKMPLGIVPRLAQTSQPANYSAGEREWKDLHTTNLITISGKTGVALYQEIVKASKNMKNKYSMSAKMWIMNEATHTDLMVEAMSMNASGAIVSGQTMTMPVIGGEIIILSDDIIADGNVVAGYGDMYILAERAGAAFTRSDEYKFADDQVAFKGTARYDGKPIIPESFMAIGLGAAPATAATFAGDAANDSRLEDVTVGTLTLSPTFDPETLVYTATATGTSDIVTAYPKQKGAAIVVTCGGKIIPNGTTVKWDSGENIVTIEVTKGMSVRTYTVKVTK